MKKPNTSFLLFILLFVMGCQPGPRLSPEELEAKWRTPLGMAALNTGICTSLQQTMQQVQAEEIDGFAAFGAVIGSGVMIRAVEEGLSQVEMTADQAELQAQIEGDVESLRAVVTAWTNQDTSIAELLSQLEETCPTITATFEQVATAAADDGLTPEAMTQIMDEMRQAMEATAEKTQ